MHCTMTYTVSHPLCTEHNKIFKPKSLWLQYIQCFWHMAYVKGQKEIEFSQSEINFLKLNYFNYERKCELAFAIPKSTFIESPCLQVSTTELYQWFRLKFQMNMLNAQLILMHTQVRAYEYNWPEKIICFQHRETELYSNTFKCPFAQHFNGPIISIERRQQQQQVIAEHMKLNDTIKKLTKL